MLVNCKECGRGVSSQAETCPHCGMRLIKKSRGCLQSGCLFAGGLFILICAIVVASGPKYKKSIETNAPTELTLPVASTALELLPPPTAIPSPTPIGAQWFYTRDEDLMAKGDS